MTLDTVGAKIKFSFRIIRTTVAWNDAYFINALQSRVCIVYKRYKVTKTESQHFYESIVWHYLQAWNSEAIINIFALNAFLRCLSVWRCFEVRRVSALFPAVLLKSSTITLRSTLKSLREQMWKSTMAELYMVMECLQEYFPLSFTLYLPIQMCYIILYTTSSLVQQRLLS